MVRVYVNSATCYFCDRALLYSAGESQKFISVYSGMLSKNSLFICNECFQAEVGLVWFSTFNINKADKTKVCLMCRRVMNPSYGAQNAFGKTYIMTTYVGSLIQDSYRFCTKCYVENINVPC